MDGATIVQRFNSLESQRKNMDQLLQDIERFVCPYRGEFYRQLSVENEVDFERMEIWDNTAVVAAKSLSSKIHGSMTSPAVKWFRLGFRNEDLREDRAAQEWLEDTEERAWRALQQSDFNTEIAEVYHDLTTFGTSIVMMEERDELTFDGLDFSAKPIMDSYFETKPDGRPDRVYSRIRYTALQLKEQFDYDIKDADAADVEARHEVLFCIYHRPDKETGDLEGTLSPEDRPIGMKYVLRKSGEVLKEGGYYTFPAMVARWSKTAGSKWGTSIAAEMIAHIKMLNATVAQVYESRAKAIDPPIITTANNIISDYDISPGGVVQVEDINELRDFPSVSPLNKEEATINRMQMDVRQAFFMDQLQMKESPAMTATEVMARREEMARFMAPTLGRMKTDLLDPIVQNAVLILLRTGQLKELPPGLEGADLDIEYISPLPRAEKAEQATSQTAWIQEILSVSQFEPSVLDIPDWDNYFRDMADHRGVPAKALRDEEEVQMRREERAKAQQAQQAAATLKDAAQAQELGARANQMEGEA